MRFKLRVMVSPKRWEGALILAGLTLFAAAASATVSPARRERAVAAYDKAQQMRATLEAQPEGKRSKEEYKKVIDAYYEVYRLNPAYSKAPVALAAIAELYQEMGREFSSDSYFLESIKSYRFLMKQYPQNRISREAHVHHRGGLSPGPGRSRTKPARLSRISLRCIPNPIRRPRPRKYWSSLTGKPRKEPRPARLPRP